MKFPLLAMLLMVAVAGCARVQTVGYGSNERECINVMRHLTQGEDTTFIEAGSAMRQRGENRVEAVTVTYAQGPARRLVTCFYRPGSSELTAIRFEGRDLSGSEMRATLDAVR